MNKTAFTFLVLALINVTWSMQNHSYAVSKDDCAIWLCLPGGFPQGCAAAHGAMIKRLKKSNPPLPSFGLCSNGGSGNYQMGYEPFEPCRDGFELKIDNEDSLKSRCLSNDIYQYCQSQTGVLIKYDDDKCYYQATKRPQPYFVKMWVGGDYLGQFFYR